jgi:hypothetical protein
MLQRMKPEDRKRVVPRVCVIGGKAAPGYDIAKRIIKLVSAVGDRINKDPDIGNLLKLVSRLLFLDTSTRTKILMSNTFSASGALASSFAEVNLQLCKGQRCCMVGLHIPSEFRPAQRQMCT